MLVGFVWALAYPEPRWSVFAWLVPGCLLAVVVRPGGVATVRLGLFGGVGLSIGLAAVSVEHPAHGRGDRRLAGIERDAAFVLGGMGLDLWRLVSLRFGGSKLAVDQAVLLWPVCRCGLGGD